MFCPRPALGSAVLAASMAACTPDPCGLEPALGGDATDEVWTTLNDARNDATEGDDAATIEEPADGATLDAAGDAPTFSWSSPLKVARVDAPLAPADPRVRRGARGVVDVASAWLIPSARAHLPPVTSDAYLLNVSWSGAECPVQATTTALEATLDAAGWDLLKSAGALTANVVSAYLQDGIITEGPFVSPTIELTVK